MTATRDLRPLFAPASVAIVGASDDTSKYGNWMARGALEGEALREVWFVNRRSSTVLGRPTYPSIGALPGPPELVVLCVPASSFEATVDEALDKGARAIVGITAGMAETGAEGAAREAAVAERVRAAGAVLLGPNCIGISDAEGALQLASDALPPGPIGLISQSGNLGLELGIKAEQAGLGFARFASVGNQSDLDVADLVTHFAEAPSIEVIAVYCEDFRDGRAFLAAAAGAAEKGKPVVLLAVGASEAAMRAARSHTAALVSSSSAIEAACAAAGIERVATPKELVDVAQALLAGRLPASSRLGIAADGGGHGAIAADVAVASGLAVPALSPGLATALAAATGTPGGTSNPVDLAGGGEKDIWSFERVVGGLAHSDEVDAVLLTGYFGGYGRYSPEMAAEEGRVADAMASVVERTGKPLAVHSMHAGGEEDRADGPLARLRAKRVPVYPSIEDAAGALGRLARRGEVLAGLAGRSVPASVEAVAAEPLGAGGYFEARSLLERAGIAFPAARAVSSVEELRKAATDIGYPVALKAAGLEHKSDAGGVVLGIADDAALERAAADLWARLDSPVLSVEQMVSPRATAELIIGSVRDLRFGPVLLAGLGGVYAEIMKDVAVALAPVDEEQAGALLASLAGAPLLTGARGRPPLAVSKAARALAALSAVAAAHPEIAELEVNPLLVAEDSVYGLDARVVLVSSTRGGGSL